MAASARIAIVAQGGVFPGVGVPWADPEQLGRQILAGACAVRPVPAARWGHDPASLLADDLRADSVRSLSACLLDLPALEPRELDPMAGLTLLAGSMAWKQVKMPSPGRVGVILGHIALPTDSTSRLARNVFQGQAPGVDPRDVHAAGLPARILREAFGLGGVACTLDAACASSLYAIKLACDELTSGRADAMLAGGVSRPDCLYTQMGFTQLRALSAGGKPRPFDAGADGLVVGEGAGVFVLKRLDDAIAAGDEILGVIAGIGLSNDIDGGLLAPNSEGQLRALRAAFAQAGWSPESVDLIECHATGTPVGDAVEARSLRTLWGETGWLPGQCILGSVKSNIGHLLTAAGSAALVKVLHAIREGVLPPTANLERLAPGLELEGSPFRVLAHPEMWPRRGNEPRRAAISGFGFGGINAHVLIEEYPGRSGEPSRTKPSEGAARLAAPTVAIVGVESRQGTLADLTFPPGRFRIPPRELEEMLAQQRVILATTADLLDRVPLPIDRTRVGAFLGVSLDLNTTNFTYRWSLPAGERDRVMPALTANRTMGALASIAASRLAREFRLGGPSHTISSEETSGLHALHAAIEALRRGELDAALVGAVDLPTDARARFGLPPGEAVADAAIVLLLEPLESAQAQGRDILGIIGPEDAVDFAIVPGEPHLGAAEGLIRLVERWFAPAPAPEEEQLFAIGGRDVAEVLRELTALRQRDFSPRPLAGDPALALVLLARNRAELTEAIDEAERHLRERADEPLPAEGRTPSLRDRVFWSPRPLGHQGQLAFVFPGSGNDYAGMGRQLAETFPDVLARQEQENAHLREQLVMADYWEGSSERTPIHRRIMAQVAVGTLVCDALLSLGVYPSASIGFSLGESAALFGLRAWTARDQMLANLEASSLFQNDLCGEFRAARQTWGIGPREPLEWTAGLVPASADAVREALKGLARAYLLIVNGPRECVLGGERAAVAELVRRLAVAFVPVPHPTSVHCPVLESVSEAYLQLHDLPTTPPAGVRFYGGGWVRAYALDQASAAQAILAQAVATLDLPALIEQAYTDGVRVFLEIGPGASASRAISQILAGRPHRTRSLLVAGQDERATFLRGLALLIAERIERPRDEETPVTPRAELSELSPLLAQIVAVEKARGDAHAAFLRQASRMVELVSRVAALTPDAEPEMEPDAQARVLPSLACASGSISGAEIPRSLDREQCLAFAIGKIGDVLGPTFAEADAYATRVRLPDEPLMLVDRILSIEGEPHSMGGGRVVTEHDILPGSWYLDGGRIPTCIAVESGQADLFLSGFLGIDRITRGQAVYRLLDAEVTFHRGLPGVGQVIRYDIFIDRFFRQGETYLFRFRFEGTVDGEPLLTMRNGCAGFFSEKELAGGKGVVQTALDRRPMAGKEPNDRAYLPPLEATESYRDDQVEALRRGDLEAAFGAAFRGIVAPTGLQLPGGRMRLVHRIERLEPRGGRFGLGLIRGEADIHPDDWFLTCHFVDDQVMPGTLMYECCLHTLRVFLLRLGWVGDGAIACEPVPGVGSVLKCRGQVIASTKKVTYEVIVKERGYGPEPYAIVDALMYADGKPVVEIQSMSLRIVGLTEEAIRRTWAQRPEPDAPARVSRTYGPETIRAFAIGKPSEAFGEAYRVFDSDRVIARLPGPPYQFLDRVDPLATPPWKMVPGGVIEAEYDVPADAWYFASDRQPVMPFAVLLEVALQPCGWLAAFVGSALTSASDLSFRNLGGDAVLHRVVTPDDGTLSTRVELTQVSSSGGMIIQGYTFAVRAGSEPIYEGTTTFGFFSKAALAQQVGLRDVQPREPTGTPRTFAFPEQAPFPDDRWRMVDQVEVYADLLRGRTKVNPEAWFFQAHFYQDPVWPGSLGLEALLQLLKAGARERWSLTPASCFVTMLGRHKWLYRGQVIPSNRDVLVQAENLRWDDANHRVTADGYLSVDGRLIYRMIDFVLALSK